MQLIGFTAGSFVAAKYGLTANETGINITKLELNFAPEFKVFMLDYQGEKRGFAIGAVELSGSLEGEVLLSASGLLTSTFSAAVTLANSVNGFGLTTGLVFFDSTVLSYSNTGWFTMKGDFSRNAGITAA